MRIKSVSRGPNTEKLSCLARLGFRKFEIIKSQSFKDVIAYNVPCKKDVTKLMNYFLRFVILTTDRFEYC